MTKLFRNDSPGAQTLEQSRDREIKRQRDLRRQAAEIAAHGRGEDTDIAHLARGEMVVPEALQTQEFLSAVRRAAKAHGISLDQLRVGSRCNSVNPSTGAAEFSYSELLTDRNRRGRSTERRVADLTVNYFPKVAGDAGHVGIGVNSTQTHGFYPQQQHPKLLGGVGVPGIVKDDDLSVPHESLRIETNPIQDARVRDFIASRTANPGNYDLYNRQCTDLVGGALRAGGVAVPLDSTINPFDDVVPRAFFPRLKDRYGQ